MAELINLRAARKVRERAKARAEAAESAARFGRTKALKALEKARAEQARAFLDGLRLSGGGREEPEA
ncbi:MAG: DUF4169 family protein [Rhodobacteraceae bacterium]|jgi:hypothetical protein|uniref:DUF4169 family protein n=1 Tax=Albidovulum sp. TaxID=1872424 RepID=UPI0026584E9E|nr:DUF4169 family protein [uncultured Defluviimonas sp.]MCC0070568.1 DUF4169 family protein [Paracoccaceae bacterium]